jgi:NADPH2:quinone reductase
MSTPLPAVLGNGVGGVVAAAGHGVDAAQVGGQVITSLRGTGGYAERAVAPADALVDVPDDVTLPDAAGLLFRLLQNELRRSGRSEPGG